MTIRMPMDQDIYDAAVKVLDTIEERLLVAKYVNSSTEPHSTRTKIDGRRNNRPPKPHKKRGIAKRQR